MRRLLRSPVVFLASALPTLVLCASSAQAGETVGDKTIDELIVELEKRGVILQAAEEQTPGSAEGDEEANELLKELLAWFARIDFYGDFRGRFEGFVFNEDALGNDRKDRYGWRYRLRFGVKTDINDYFDAAFRLATGSDAKSSNQTLGSGVDFDPDGIFVDQAYLTVTPFGAHELPMDQFGYVRFGKMSNPFISRAGDDLVLFDRDIQPEGLWINYGLSLCDCLDLNLDLAYFLVEEISDRSADPHLLALQLEKTWRPTDDLTLGLADSFYFYRNLDQDFFDRGSFGKSGFGRSSGGNVPGGLSDGNTVHIMDYRAYVQYAGFDDWPLMVFGNFVKNITAENTSGFNAGKEDTGWSVGLQAGDKKKWVQMSAAYFQVEANAVPANFTDSDLFDGRTNGEGWHFKLARQIFENIDLKADLFLSDALDHNLYGATTSPGGEGDPPEFFDDAVRDHDRLRFRIDVVVKW